MTEHIDSNQNLAPTEYALLVEHGLKGAEELGFNLDAAVAANTAGRERLNNQGREHILATAARLAEDAELDREFFDRPANAVLLMAVADSWVVNERIAAGNQGHDERLSAERQALADTVLIMAGTQSGVVRRLVEADPVAARKYVEAESNREQADIEREEWFETLNDEALAAEVQAVLADEGEGAFLQEARAKLGLTAAAETPYRVRVLKMADNKWEFVWAGQLKPATYPSWDGYREGDEATRQAIRDATGEYDALEEEQRQFVAPYVAALKEFAERFGDHFGPMPPAYVTHHDDGPAVLTLLAPTAYALVNHQRGTLDLSGTEGWLVKGWFAMVEHEWKHAMSNRWMAQGPDAQIGLMLEERAAELVGHDAHGYLDIKHLMNLLTLATGSNVVTHLEKAIQHDDPLSVFTSRVAQELGLRTLLLLTVAKPLPYEEMPRLASRFVDLSWLRQPSDSSQLDSILRDTIARHGMRTFEANVRGIIRNNRFRGSSDLLGILSRLAGHGLSYALPIFERLVHEELGE